MLKDQRQQFEMPRDICYLNCAYMAPRLRSVSEAGRLAFEASRTPWQLTAADFFRVPEQLRGSFARLIGATDDDIALVPSVSYAMAVAGANLSLTSQDEILILAEQFPSNVYPWQRLAQEHGARIQTVTRPDNSDWTTAVLAALGERTRIAALPQAHWTDGTRLDLVRIGERCRELNCALVLDLTQSLGALPFAIADVRPDFMVAAAYKWLLGPYGVSYLYVAPQHQHGRPLEEPWLARAGSENFSALVDYQPRYRDGARRFDAGEHTGFLLLPMALAALRQILAWQPERIASRLAQLTGKIADHSAALGFTVTQSSWRSPHMLGLRSPLTPPQAFIAALRQAGVYVSVRGNCIRVAPHLHNDGEDLQRFFAVITKFAP